MKCVKKKYKNFYSFGESRKVFKKRRYVKTKKCIRYTYDGIKITCGTCPFCKTKKKVKNPNNQDNQDGEDNQCNLTSNATWRWFSSVTDSRQFIPGSSMDLNGNTYISSRNITGLPAFYDSDGSLSTVSNFPGAPTNNLIVCKIDIDGVWKWTARIMSSQFTQGRIFTDANGNSYVGFFFRTSATFYNKDETTTSLNIPTFTSNASMGVAKINTDGFWEWAVSADGSVTDHGDVLSLDKDGNIYVNMTTNSSNLKFYDQDGSLNNTINLPPFLTNISGFQVSQTALLGKINSSGIWQWVVVASSPTSNGDNPYSVITDDNGYIYCGINFTGDDITFYDSDGNESPNAVVPLNFTQSNGAVIGKIDINGFWIWTVCIDGDALINEVGIATDNSENIYIAVETYSNTTFYNSDATSANSSLNIPAMVTNGSCFVGKVNQSGYWQWAATTDGANYEYYNGIIMDSSNNIFTTLTIFEGPTIFYNSDGSVSDVPIDFTYVSSGVVIATLDTNGFWGWTVYIDGTGDEEYSSISIDNLGNLSFVFLSNSNSLTFYNSDGTDSGLTSQPFSLSGLGVAMLSNYCS